VMSRFSFAATLLAVTMGVLVAADPAAQKSADAEMLFQTASHAELVEGDLDKAIRLYREVIAKFPGDRAVAARALVKLGACYEKTGRAAARAAYERVLRDYADQPEAVRTARRRLQQLPEAAPSSRAPGRSGPTYRLVLDRFVDVRGVAFFPGQYDFAPDGRRFVYRALPPEKNTSVLFVADAEGALVRPLLADTGTWWGFQYPRWAPTGNRVAYLVHKAPYESPGPWGIFVADVDTGKATQIGADFPDGHPPGDLVWTADGREITYVVLTTDAPVPTGVYSRSIATGDTRVVQAMPGAHWSLRLGGYSPDGRWLAFHQQTSLGGDRRYVDVWLMPAGGGRALKQTEHGGIDAQPVWAPDGRALYFVSDRTGDQNVWKLGIEPATGSAVGEPQQVTFFTDGRVMHPRLFAAGRRMALLLSHNKTVIKVGSPERPNEARELTRGRAPQLSPDGLRLYYIGEGPEQQGLFAIPTAGGVPTRLAPLPRGNCRCGFDLSPDGRFLTYLSKDGNYLSLVVLSTSGGAPRALVERIRAADSLPISPPRWSPDGTRIAYAVDQTLFTIPATGGQPRTVAQLYNWQEWLWAPDGKSIGALAYAAPEDIAVFVVSAEGGEPRRLTTPAERGYKEGLAWHPDGRRLAYMIYVGAGERDSALREAFVDGRPTSTIVEVPNEWEYVGRWTPDGKEFLYQVLRGGSGAVHAFNPETRKSRLFAERVQIGVGGLAHGMLTWSADSRVIAWATPSITSQLWVAENFR
jgi:Tol biopolymer transport system component